MHLPHYQKFLSMWHTFLWELVLHHLQLTGPLEKLTKVQRYGTWTLHNTCMVMQGTINYLWGDVFLSNQSWKIIMVPLEWLLETFIDKCNSMQVHSSWPVFNLWPNGWCKTLQLTDKGVYSQNILTKIDIISWTMQFTTENLFSYILVSEKWSKCLL